jgi:hypothetical protein
MMFHHHSLEYLIPALHERGFEREADVLNVFSRIVGTR